MFLYLTLGGLQVLVLIVLNVYVHRQFQQPHYYWHGGNPETHLSVRISDYIVLLVNQTVWVLQIFNSRIKKKNADKAISDSPQSILQTAATLIPNCHPREVAELLCR